MISSSILTDLRTVSPYQEYLKIHGKLSSEVRIPLRISYRGAAVSYRPHASPSFEIAKPREITAISVIIIIIIIIMCHFALKHCSRCIYF